MINCSLCINFALWVIYRYHSQRNKFYVHDEHLDMFKLQKNYTLSYLSYWSLNHRTHSHFINSVVILTCHVYTKQFPSPCRSFRRKQTTLYYHWTISKESMEFAVLFLQNRLMSQKDAWSWIYSQSQYKKLINLGCLFWKACCFMFKITTTLITMCILIVILFCIQMSLYFQKHWKTIFPDRYLFSLFISFLMTFSML